MTTDSRSCIHCGRTLRRHRWHGVLESLPTFESRRFCNYYCVNSFRAVNVEDRTEPKICPTCGAEFSRTRNTEGFVTETWQHFEKRKGCSADCGRKLGLRNSVTAHAAETAPLYQPEVMRQLTACIRALAAQVASPTVRRVRLPKTLRTSANCDDIRCYPQTCKRCWIMFKEVSQS